MARVRIEWARLVRGSAPGGATLHQPTALYGAAQVVNVGATPLSVGPAPSFGADGDVALAGYARVTSLSGAALLAWGAAPLAGEASGWRIDPGSPALVPIQPGQSLSLVACADPPVAATDAAVQQLHADLAGGLTVLSPQAPVTTVRTVATGVWQRVWVAGPAKRLILALPSDSGASGDFSFDATLAGTTTSAGVPFAAGAGGSFDFAGGAIPSSDLYVKATAGASIIVQVFN